ncbi:MAG: alkaline phosphatase family protein [Deltaproteobacteria bacterium]|nr:alkaline phosphatase family protein [Deltaproteobacteria bacterium]
MSSVRHALGMGSMALALAAGTGCDGASDDAGGEDPSVTRIAFGSCMNQNKPKPVLELAAASRPDLFVFLGDNLYGDTEDMSVMAAKYATLGASPELATLRDAAPIAATWDDHDYGANDAGKEYPKKAESKALFLDFWGEPADSARRTRDGIYTAYRYELPGGVLQVLLLDTRWFRDPLEPNMGAPYQHDYQPTTDLTRTMLGEAQWTWLEERLREPADVRLVGTSTQFGHSYNGWESWTNLPHERQRMIELVASTGANGVVFMSGDVHWGELSRQTTSSYPLYDVTSSGITQTWFGIDSNDNRVGEAVPENNYGFIDIAWRGAETALTLGLVDVAGTVRVTHEVPLAELQHTAP